MKKMISPFVRTYIIFHSILLFFIINQPVLSQVEIQEEIILDSAASIEGQTLTMPFYGNISGCVNWAAMWWGWLKDVVIEAGGQSVTMGFGCGAGYTVCNWSIRNVSALSQVNIIVYGSCDNNGQMIEAETQVISTGTNEYTINYMDQWGNWSFATTVQFIATTPPGCDDAPLCQSSYSLPTITNFDYPIFFDQSTSHYIIYDRCASNEHAQGFFTLADNEIVDISVQNPCFDIQSQKWQFEYTLPIKIKSVLGLCKRDDYTFITSINEIPDWYLCPPNHGKSRFIIDLWGKYYKKGVPLYMPEDLVREEEMIHFNQFVEEINKLEWQNRFSELYKSKIVYNCTDYTNLEDVENSIYDKVIIPFRNEILKYIAIDIGSILEEKAHKDLEQFFQAWEMIADREIVRRHCN